MALLPFIGDIAGQSKRRKSEFGSLRSTYSVAMSLDLSALGSNIDKLSGEEKEWLLVSKFGLTRVNEVCRVLRLNLQNSHLRSKDRTSCSTVWALCW